MLKLLVAPCTFTKEDDSAYKYFIALSTDKLLILEKVKQDEYNLVETIVSGVDNDGLLLSAPDENAFLDAITTIKAILLSGNNPLVVLNCF